MDLYFDRIFYGEAVLDSAENALDTGSGVKSWQAASIK